MFFTKGQTALFWNIALIVYHRRSQDFWLEAAQTTNHIGENQEKKVFTVRLRSFDWGGGEILLETNLGLEGEPTTTYIVKTKTKKQQEQVSRSEELNFFRKKVKSQKRKVFMVSCQGEHKPRKETDERIAVLVANLSLLAWRLGGLDRRPFPPGYAYVVYTQNFWTKFLSICTVITLYLMQIRTNKNAHEKEHAFSRRSKTKNKTEKVSKHFNFATKHYAIKIFSALKTINLLFNWFCTALNIKRYGFSYKVVF